MINTKKDDVVTPFLYMLKKLDLRKNDFEYDALVTFKVLRLLLFFVRLSTQFKNSSNNMFSHFHITMNFTSSSNKDFHI